MNGRDYITNEINLSKNMMENKERLFVYGKLTNRTMLIIYRPEIDVSPVFNPKESQEYQQFVVIARWII